MYMFSVCFMLLNRVNVHLVVIHKFFWLISKVTYWIIPVPKLLTLSKISPKPN